MGTRRRFKRGVGRLGDHPHAYGDKQILPLRVGMRLGSSPRVWGQVDKLSDLKYTNGIIPTRMGTSNAEVEENPQRQDHPHAYGDKRSDIHHERLLAGSSPRVWGQVNRVPISSISTRIIPTRMGTSLFTCNYIGVHKDHPHAYGDKIRSR